MRTHTDTHTQIISLINPKRIKKRHKILENVKIILNEHFFLSRELFEINLKASLKQ